MHKIGTAFKLNIIRGDEIIPVADDKHYDFDF